MPVSLQRYLWRKSCFHEPEIANKIALRKEAAKFPSFLIYILVSRNRPLSSLLLPLLSFAAAVATIQTVLLYPMYELVPQWYPLSSSVGNTLSDPLTFIANLQPFLHSTCMLLCCSTDICIRREWVHLAASLECTQLLAVISRCGADRKKIGKTK